MRRTPSTQRYAAPSQTSQPDEAPQRYVASRPISVRRVVMSDDRPRVPREVARPSARSAPAAVESDIEALVDEQNEDEQGIEAVRRGRGEEKGSFFERLIDAREEDERLDEEEMDEEKLLDPSLQMTEEELLAQGQGPKEKKKGVLASTHGVGDEGATAERTAQLKRIMKNQRKSEGTEAVVAEIPDYIVSGQYRAFTGDEGSAKLEDKVLGTVSRYSVLNGSYDGRHRNEILKFVGSALEKHRQHEDVIRQRRAGEVKKNV